MINIYSTGFSIVTKSLPFLNTLTLPDDSETTMATALVTSVMPAAAMCRLPSPDG
jgi:hypothetical protein